MKKYKKNKSNKKNNEGFSNKSNKKFDSKNQPKLEVEGQRIQKVLANLGLGSRREIEKLILENQIRVNKQLATPGQKLIGNELVQIGKRKVVLSNMKSDNKTRIIALHKATGIVSTRKDEHGRPNVFQKLPSIRNSRWVMVGRLDINTQGLLLFTNDGKLANDLMHPKNEIEREYLVRVFGRVTEEKLQLLEAGIELEDGMAKFESIHTISKEEEINNMFFKVVLKEGRNREIRRMWEAVDCQVSRLKRISYAGFELPKNLKQNQTQELTKSEVRAISNLIKET